MFLKIHHAPDGGTVVALCDGELLNTTLDHDGVTIPVTESFYGNQRVSPVEAADALRQADNANIMGERAVALAVSIGIITRSSCIMIGNVPHAQVFRL